jgi:cytochrome b subunit of formate dehydrogenase
MSGAGCYPADKNYRRQETMKIKKILLLLPLSLVATLSITGTADAHAPSTLKPIQDLVTAAFIISVAAIIISAVSLYVASKKRGG